MVRACARFATVAKNVPALIYPTMLVSGCSCPEELIGFIVLLQLYSLTRLSAFLSPHPSCRHFGRLLLRGLCVAGAADDLHHRRVPAAEAAQLSGRLPADHPEAAVLFRLHCGGPARRLLYHTGKGTVPCFEVVVVVIVAFSLFYANFYSPR